MHKVIVAGVEYASISAVKARASDILNSGPLGSEIRDGLDYAFLESLLLEGRSDKLPNMHGMSVIGFRRALQDGAVKSTRCFWAVLSDGTLLDFSFYKAAEQLARIQRGAAGQI